jgi:hypothetical protein
MTRSLAIALIVIIPLAFSPEQGLTNTLTATTYAIQNGSGTTLTFNSLGIVESLDYNGVEQLNADTALSRIHFSDGSFAVADSVTPLGPDTYRIEYLGSDTEIELKVTPAQRYFVFTILDVIDPTDDIDEIELYSLDPQHVPSRDRAWAVGAADDELFLNFLPLYVETICGPSDAYFGCRASKWMGFTHNIDPATCSGGIAAYWTFDDSSDGGKDDYNGYDASVVGATRTTETFLPQATGSGGALDFDGTDDSVALPPNVDTSLKNDVSTFLAWMKIESVGPNAYASAYSGQAGFLPGSVNIRIRPAGPSVAVGNVSGLPDHYDFPFTINLNQWYHQDASRFSWTFGVGSESTS